MSEDEDIAAINVPLFPYQDGSGFEIIVRIECEDGDDPAIIIKASGDKVVFDAARWPEIRGQIDRITEFFENRRPAEPTP